MLSMPSPERSFSLPPPSAELHAQDFDSHGIGNDFETSPRPTSVLHLPLSPAAASKPQLSSLLSTQMTQSLSFGDIARKNSRNPNALPASSLHSMVDQQRCALLEHLTNQHCALVQFVEKQFEMFLMTINFQSRTKTRNTLSSIGVMSAFEEASAGLQDSNHGAAVNPKVTADKSDSKFCGRILPNGVDTIPSIAEGDQPESSLTASAIVGAQTRPSFPDISRAANRDSGAQLAVSYTSNYRSSISNVFTYIKTNLTAQAALDRHFQKKKLSKVEIRKAKTDLHIEEQLGKTNLIGLRAPQLDFFVAVVICLNGLTMALEVEWRGYKLAKGLGLNVDEDSWPNAELFFLILEHVYTAIFILEMVLRLYYQSYRYFYEKANVFDAFLVFSAVLDTYVLALLETEGAGRNLTLLRYFRLFKFARVFRAVRMLKFCSSLRVLVKTIVTGCYSLVWSLVLLGLIICGAGIVAAQLTENSIADEKLPYERRMWIFHYYGTALRSMYTIFEVTLSGCWPNYARRLIHEVSGWWALFWLIYILLVVFAVLRIISAIFLKDTLNNAKADADMMIAEQIKTKEGYLVKLRNAFEAIDTKGAGVVTRREFDFVLQHPKVSAYLAVLDLEVHESSLLFNLLDEEGSGSITYEEFLEGVMRLKGQARALDVIALQQDFKSLWKGLSYISDNFERVFGLSNRTDPSAISARRLFERKARGSLSGGQGSRCPDSGEFSPGSMSQISPEASYGS